MIQQAVKLYEESKAECVMSVTKLDFYPEHALKICDRNRLHPVSWATIDKKRQELEVKFKHDGSITICNTKAFLSVGDFYDLDTIPFEVENSIDINTPHDWKVAETILGEK